MLTKKKAVKDYTGEEFVVARQFVAARALVFQAWTEARHLAQWWGPRGFTNPVCQWNAQPGHLIHVVMRAPNGADYPMGGEFREIVAPERLVFTSGALDDKGNLLFEFLHTITFVERKGKTTLTIKSRVIKTTTDANKYIGGFEAGMKQSLEKLANHLAEIDTPLPIQRTVNAPLATAPKKFGENETAGREIVLTRVVDAPQELVWQAMTDPRHWVHWWGPRGFTTTIKTMDVRPRGLWKHVMHGPDGIDYPNESVFTEVVKPERIAFSHRGGRKGGTNVQFEATWTFDAVDAGKTRVTIRMVFPSATARDKVVEEYGAIEGGKQTLQRLAEHLTKMP